MSSDTISILNPIVKSCDLENSIFSLTFSTNNYMHFNRKAVLSALLIG